MSDYYVTATRKDGADADRRIDAFKVNGAWYPIDQMLGFVDAGHRFYVDVRNTAVRVWDRIHPHTRRRFLTTEVDGYPYNNLLNLPDN